MLYPVLFECVCFHLDIAYMQSSIALFIDCVLPYMHKILCVYNKPDPLINAFEKMA
jgi:hypothetical protein